MLQHQLMVARQVRLTLYAIDDQHLGRLARRRQQLHVRREASASQTYDAGCGDLVHDLLGLQGALRLQLRRAVDSLGPLVALYVDHDHLHRCTPCISSLVDLAHRTAYGRCDIRTYESAGLGQQVAYFHFLTNLHSSLCRRTDMLHQRNDSLLRQRTLRNGLMG